jgi:hypothetical protein
MLGLFGPKEPWGMYRKRPVFKPVSKDETFEVNGDLPDVRLELR